MAQATLASGAPKRQTDLGIIDCDIHPNLPDTKALHPYIPSKWKDRLGDFDIIAGKFDGPRYRVPVPTNRASATTPSGGRPASDPEFLIKDHIEPHNITYGVLLPYQMSGLGIWTNADEAAVWGEALNRYFIDHWTSDPRFKLCIVASPHDPLLAAAEIRRCGGTPGVSGIWLPLLNILMGRRYWYPIYEAAAEMGLPIMLHGSGGSSQGSPTIGGGVWEYQAERYAALASGGVASDNVVSLVFSGTFERFPGLKVIFVEMGFTWVGPQMWKMDKSWKTNRSEVPWVRRLPSEYVIDHCRFTTQPMDEPAQPEFLIQSAYHAVAERTLLMATDYPHWDSDDPRLTFGRWPADLKERIFRENAYETFGSLMPRQRAGA